MKVANYCFGDTTGAHSFCGLWIIRKTLSTKEWVHGSNSEDMVWKKSHKCFEMFSSSLCISHAALKVLNIQKKTKKKKNQTTFKIISQNHRIAQVGKDLKDHRVQPQPDHSTLTNNPLLNHVPEHHIQMVFKYMQGWWLKFTRSLRYVTEI